MTKKSMRILVVRNDKLGDFMLVWPALALLKRYFPEAHIIALVPEYTAPIATLCPSIDELLIEPEDCGVFTLSTLFKGAKLDAALVFFSTARIAFASLLSGVPYRLAPATKIIQYLYNHRLVQRRSHSKKPEYLYNLELAAQLLIDFNQLSDKFSFAGKNDDYLPTEISRPFLAFNNDLERMKCIFLKEHKLSEQTKLIFIHPGSGGSAANLTIGQYAHLADAIVNQLAKKQITASIVICAGPNEMKQAEAMQAQLAAVTPSCLYHSTEGLRRFAETLEIADVFISGSTGVLHIAGALDIFNVGFYPTKRSSSALRWQTLGNPENGLAFTLPENGSNLANRTLDKNGIVQVIINKF